jgi:S-methylmethionine-dependent homocysteine/selenocysteine methylase
MTAWAHTRASRGTISAMDATRFRAALASPGVVVLDGGLATQLEAQGEDLSDRLWSARLLEDRPEAIVDAHLAYFRAGARVATTASYQATFEGFAARGIGHADAVELLRRSVKLAAGAREAYRAEAVAAGRPEPGPLFVAASVGPYGAMLADGSEYRGRYGRTVGELRDFHRERLAVLAGTEADVLAVETIPEFEEAVAVAGLLGELEGAAAWISFSCADGGHVRSGAPIEEAVAAVAESPGVLAVGVNCTAPEHAEELVERIRATTDLPIAVYPNSGEGWDAIARRWTGTPGPTVDGATAGRWLAAGATLIGGCCRVTPDRIAEVAGAIAH